MGRASGRLRSWIEIVEGGDGYRRLERLWRDGRRDKRKGGDRIVNHLSTCIFKSSYSLFPVHGRLDE